MTDISATKSVFRNERLSDLLIMVVLYLGAFVIHLLLMADATIFNLTPDEYSVTAVAAYITGLDWSSTVSTGGYYGYFQSLFYIPAFLFTDEPYLRYKLMLGINALLISFAPVIVYYLCRRQFSTDRLAAALFSVICGLYPCYLLLTKYTWNETMCCLLPWVFILLLYKAAGSEKAAIKQALSALGGLTLAAAYATHGRMLALLAAGIVTVLISHFMLKKRTFCMVGFFIGFGVAITADFFIKAHLQDALWLVSEKDSAPVNTIERMISRLFSSDLDTVGYFFSTLAGHFYYFLTATWGFGAVCIVLIIVACVKLCRNVYKRTVSELDSDTSLLCVFAFLLMGAIFAVSVLFKCTSSLIDERMDSAIYGRYTEAFYPVAIFAALLLIYKGRLSGKCCFGSLCTAVGINVVALFITRPLVTSGSRFVCAMILGIAPMRFGEGIRTLLTDDTFIKLTVANMAGIVLFVLMRLIFARFRCGYLFVSLPLACLLGYSVVSNFNGYTHPQYKNSHNGAAYMEEAIDLVSDADKLCLVDISKERYVKAQFLYPEKTLDILDGVSQLSGLSEPPEIILSNKEQNLHLWLDDVYLIGDVNNKVQVYTVSDKADEFNASAGNGCMEYDTLTILDNGPVSRQDNVVFIPMESSVYTNYATWHGGASLEITAVGGGIGGAKITVTADKGNTDIPYLVSDKTENSITIKINIGQKCENVRIELENSVFKPISFEKLTIRRISGPVAEISK